MPKRRPLPTQPLRRSKRRQQPAAVRAAGAEDGGEEEVNERLGLLVNDPSRWHCNVCGTTDELLVGLASYSPRVLCLAHSGKARADARFLDLSEARLVTKRGSVLTAVACTSPALLQLLDALRRLQDLDGGHIEIDEPEDGAAAVADEQGHGEQGLTPARARWATLRQGRLALSATKFIQRIAARHHQHDCMQSALFRWRFQLEFRVFAAWRGLTSATHASRSLEVARARSAPRAGLRNLGNTCYLAATVQAFAHMPRLALELKADYAAAEPLSRSTSLVEPFSHARKKRPMQPTSTSPPPQTKRSRVSDAAVPAVAAEDDQASLGFHLARTLFALDNTAGHCRVTPAKLLNAVWTTIPEFRGFKQHDAEELARSMLSKLPVSSRAVLGQGKTVSDVVCSECGRCSTSSTPLGGFWSVQLPTPSAKLARGRGTPPPLLLEELLAQAVKPEGIPTYCCEGGCGANPVHATKTERLAYCPPVLFVHVVRTAWTPRGHQQKRMEPVLPRGLLEPDGTPTIDLSPYCRVAPPGQLARCPSVYDVCAMVAHQGRGMRQGHYLCYARDQAAGDGPKWLCFNDDKVSTVDIAKLRTEQVTLFGLQRRDLAHLDPAFLTPQRGR